MKSTFTSDLRIRQICDQYHEMLNTGFCCSIQDMLNFDDFRLDNYCRKLSPHPRSEEIIQIARQYCEKYDMWTPQAIHYITCELYLYPSAEFSRMLTMLLNNAIDYRLNDIMGRDLFGHLEIVEQEKAKAMIGRMASVGEDLQSPPDPTPLVFANLELLREMKNNSTPSWFTKFLNYYKFHLEVTHRNGNTAEMGHIPTVEEYISLRCHTSGMHHIVLLIQYAKGNFIGNGYSAFIPEEMLSRIDLLTARFGCLSNDLFSFEKEVIDAGTDANLVAIIALNMPQLSLKEAIYKTASIVQADLSELIQLIGFCYQKLENMPEQNGIRKMMLEHLIDIELCIQASWLWQVYTQRYKRRGSIWQETNLTEAISRAV